MPVIVDEVIISVEVANPAGTEQGAGASSVSTEKKQEIISECVERVLEILEQRRER